MIEIVIDLLRLPVLAPERTTPLNKPPSIKGLIHKAHKNRATGEE